MNEPVSRISPVVALFDRVVAAVALASAFYLSARAIPPGQDDWLNGTLSRWVIYGAIALLVVLGLMAARRLGGSTVRRALVRVPFVALGLLLCWMAYSRTKPQGSRWPSKRTDSMAWRLFELSPVLRASWGAQVAMHRATTRPAEAVLSIPADWAFPVDVSIAVERSGADTVRVWARTADGMVRCVARPVEQGMGMKSKAKAKAGVPGAQGNLAQTEGDPRMVTRGCTGRAEPPIAQFLKPLRVQEAPAAPATDVVGEPWPQYRRDGTKSATVATGGTVGWHSRLDGPSRSSFSVVGNSAFLGAHMTGTLASYDIANGALRWSSRLPDWIHQDVVSDGRVAVVGFGDNTLAPGRFPSGVAAYAAADGRHLWTRFDEATVMTSPVLHDSVLVYATSAGIVRKRLLSTGALLAEKLLPGGVIMGPPAAIGDTIVFSLDPDGVCALLISSMQTLWCRAMPFHLETGHSSPSIVAGTVISSSRIRPRAASLRELSRLPGAVLWRQVRSLLEMNFESAGQRIQAFRLSDGTPLWSSRLFPDLRVVDGHPSGTAAIHDSIGVMVLPTADTIAAFDIRTGRVLWAAGAHESRGPPLIIGGTVLNAGHDGTTELRDVATGKLACTMTRATGYDRAGPTIAGGLVLFSNLKGELEAIPRSALLGCDAAALRAPPP